MNDTTVSSTAGKRIHPLMAGAAGAVIIACGVGVAAMTGLLPGSQAEKADAQAAAPATTSTATGGAKAPAAAPTQAAKPTEQSPAKPAQTSPQRTQVASAQQAQAPAKVACPACGTVVDVKEVEVKGEGSGVGAAAGGVAGGVLGNTIGEGSGNRGVATIAGAAVGAFAGHQIEKAVKTKKHYEVAVRMQDGSTRTMAYAEQPSWKAGDRVKVNGTQLAPQ